jgi:cyclohexadienyl dehydratase
MCAMPSAESNRELTFMINRRLVAAAALAVPALGFAQKANAQLAPKSRLGAIVESNTLRVGTTGDFNPMSFRVAGTEGYVGHEIDCANLLAADLGVKPVFVPTDWKTLVNGLTADQYDIVMTGTSMSAARAAVATFVDSWGRNAFVPLVQKKDLEKFHDWSALDQPGVTIATNLGTTMEQFVQQTLPKATLRRVESPARDYQELLGGRVDATMSSMIEAAALTKEYPDLAILFPDKPRNPIPMAFMIPQGDPIWLAFMNNWTTIRRASGAFDAIAKKWNLATA